nr:hypothetical protein [Planococcus antarcticus]
MKPAIDAVSHFTVSIEQLVYIPPTMSPTPKVSGLADYLEHPKEAIEYYRSNGIHTMIAEKNTWAAAAFCCYSKTSKHRQNTLESNHWGQSTLEPGSDFSTVKQKNSFLCS